MTTFDSIGKVAYVYDQSDDKWYPVAGYASTTVPYSWSGTHEFTNTVTFNSVLNAKAGINNFLDPAARDLVISSPTNGIVVFLRQTNEGQILNQIQYYYNGAWRIYGENAQLFTRSLDFTLALSDAGRTIDAESATSMAVTIPLNSSVPFLVGTQIAFIQTGAGQLVFVPASGVTLLSKNNNKKVAARYSPATLIQKSADTWVLIGDLTA
jgi:phosphohistidine swiveling domain-containing protein